MPTELSILSTLLWFVLNKIVHYFLLIHLYINIHFYFLSILQRSANQYNESSARSTCETMFKQSKAVTLCIKLSLVNTEQYLDQCALDLMVSFGTYFSFFLPSPKGDY